MSEFINDSSLTLQQRIHFFRGMINCENQIEFWIYGSDYRLIQSTTDKVVLDTIFSHTGCMNYMKQHFSESDKPLILSSFLGLMWCSVKLTAPGGGAALYIVMGPVFNSEISLASLREAAARYAVEESWRDGFVALLHGLSTVPTSMFFYFALMLEYAVSGRQLSMRDISFQHSAEFNNGDLTHFRTERPLRSDRSTVYYIEEKLMNNIRTGNSNYDNDFVNARKLSNGIRITTSEPVFQSILSCTTFISLCTRAAIQGGLSPDTAYSIGDGYIQAAVTCSNITELSTLIHKMYDQFINEVKKKQEKPGYSRQVQSCIDYIENHIYEDIQLSDLAAHTGYTDYYLSRKFKEETGTSLRRAVMQKKLERGAELLCATTDPVSVIAERLQFCSASYFSTRFREQYGVLPQKYRDENQKL